MNIKTKEIVILSVTLILIGLMYSWMNRFQLYEYHLKGDTIIVRENLLTGHRCTLNEGQYNYKTKFKNTDYIKLFPKHCDIN